MRLYMRCGADAAAHAHSEAALQPPGGADAVPSCCLIRLLSAPLFPCSDPHKGIFGRILSVVKYSDGSAAAQRHFERILLLTAPHDGIRSGNDD